MLPGSKGKLPSSREKNISNRLLSKVSAIKKKFNEYRFSNICLKGATFSGCGFKNCNFYGVDFVGANLKKCNFSGSKFVRCIFVGVRVSGSNFKGATFENCTFVNQSFEKSKNFVHPDFSAMQYPTQVGGLSVRELFAHLDELIPGRFRYARLVKLKGGKVNNLTLYLLIRRFTEDVLECKLRLCVESNVRQIFPAKIYSYRAFEKIIDSVQV
ncbi:MULTISPECIES: pentapeptide repeat-containing protein [Pseudomonas aeruginosa group]|uniref:pentapeptide repeat-containing protein n=1 Tax=Pseudomonas aeruginosa group TaxID=136841 RepID=UPI001376DD57|nr:MULTISPECIES: pentapeptide repeat-containing protein [Pseudomonas aeruginosa group]MBG6888376.1 pentapeptide repeat-containing protein [Pseudomonas aeruginosa]MDV7900390.1 pentapeptide repeat-containing protein [Pseudomonas aeruginosa]